MKTVLVCLTLTAFSVNQILVFLSLFTFKNLLPELATYALYPLLSLLIIFNSMFRLLRYDD